MTSKKMAKKVHGANIYKCLYTWNVVELLTKLLQSNALGLAVKEEEMPLYQ